MLVLTQYPLPLHLLRIINNNSISLLLLPSPHQPIPEIQITAKIAIGFGMVDIMVLTTGVKVDADRVQQVV